MTEYTDGIANLQMDKDVNFLSFGSGAKEAERKR